MTYHDADRERRVGQGERDGRTAFQRDRARVLHSSALRRLAGKTQVVEPVTASPTAPRTRLTHSLECAQIGRELGGALGCDPDLVDAACLAHDLGHPPYGHNGETALDAAAQPCGGFEGNAQSLRVLTRLEVKVPGAGLDLTRAALDAATKYPWARRPGTTKYGVYEDDRPVFAWLREGVPDGVRCLESQVMDWADDVAYSVHDLEDGVLAGLVRLPELADPVERDELATLAAQVYSDQPAAALREVLDGLLDLPEWPRTYDGGSADTARLKAAASRLIGRFCRAAERATRERHGPEPLTRYAADLVVPRRQRAECALVKAVTARYVMARAGVVRAQERERQVVSELVDALCARPEALDALATEAWQAAGDDAARLRAVVDHVASLTDATAEHLHRLLVDGRQPSGGPRSMTTRQALTRQRGRSGERGRRGGADQGRGHRPGPRGRRIDEVIGERLQLKPAGGGRLKGLCPFHDEKSPSFSVNPSLGFYHCLAGETRVLTWQGTRAIRDLAGGTHRVLSRRGNWVDAPFRSYGQQALLEVTLARNGLTKVVRATSGHRWFVRSGKGRAVEREVLTTGLREGHRLVTRFPRQRTARTEPSAFGIAHGITYGDGTLGANGSHALLCGEKDAQLMKWFPMSRTRQFGQNLSVLDLPKFFKERPDVEESTSYLYGWLAGYLAADGHVSKDGTVMLNSARREDLQFVRDLCTRIGVGTYGITTQVREGFPGREPSEIHRIHFVNDSLTPALFLLQEHRERFESVQKKFARVGWTVQSVVPTGVVEEVFCAEVEEGHAFVLEDNLLTGNCFGCGASGDVISFLRDSEHLSFVEAIEMLAGRYGVQLTYEQGTAAPRQQGSQRARYVDANKQAAAFYAEQLDAPAAGSARAFLAERGFDRAAAATYGLGFAPEGWDVLVKHLRAQGFSAEELLAAGLASTGRQGPIDRFRNRLVWPIRDLPGEIVGFGARKLSTDPGDDSPKYLNTPETPLYKKSTVLYGVDHAKKEIARRRQVVVVEGYTDVMACHLAGVPTAVATCGTSFGAEHIAVLRRLLMDAGDLRGEVVFLFDGDAAGQKAALKAFDSDQEFVTQTFVAVSPGGSDPCELRLAKGDDAVRDLVAGRVPLVEFALRSVLDRYDLETAEGRVAALRAAGPLVAKIKDRALRPEYARRLAGWLGADVETVVGRVAELTGEPVAPRQRGPRPPSADSAALAVEREAVKLAVQAPVLVAPLFDAVDEAAWTDPALRSVRALVAAQGGVSGTPGGEPWVARLREAAGDDALRSLVTVLAVEPVRSDLEPDSRYGTVVLNRLQELAHSRRIAELQPQLQRTNPVEEAERYHRLFTELVSLQQTVQSLRAGGTAA